MGTRLPYEADKCWTPFIGSKPQYIVTNLAEYGLDFPIIQLP